MLMQVFVPCALLQYSHANTVTHQQSVLTAKTPSTWPLQTHAQSARRHYQAVNFATAPQHVYPANTAYTYHQTNVTNV